MPPARSQEHDEERRREGPHRATPRFADYYNSRAQLITALFGLADDQLDAKPGDGGWTIRETIEHVLDWDRNSIDTLKTES